MSNSTLSYRNDLQGLRALAVIAVLFFHIWPDSYRGGFIGVDVFFVISGFLITSLLILEAEKKQRIDLANFWSRRMRRLLPAATLVLLISLFLAFFYMPESDWLNTAKQVFASSLYFQNWMLVAQSVDYMAREASATVVQHYWSLSIEEQFYIAWPLFIALAAAISRSTKRRVRNVALVFSIVLLISSFCISAFVYLGAPHGYFTSTTRVWELSLGATLALLWPYIQWKNVTRVILSWMGFILVVLSIFVIKQDQNFPGYIALLPTVGAILLILGNQVRGAAGTLLGYQPLRYIGDISYAVYLWHWPLVVLAKQAPEIQQLPSWQQSGGIIVATLTLSVLTKYLVEDPFRHGFLAFGLRSQKRTLFVTSSIVSAVVLVATSSSIALF
ncbi:MAG TPA: acyltransferase, partial [Turneriella sp.]|nr:acyltransferase [Turneriella sp.]